MIPFIIAGICLILAFITDRFAKDPVVEKPVFNKRKLIWVILVFLLAFGACTYWSWLNVKGIKHHDILKTWHGIAPIAALIAIIFIIQVFIEKSKPSTFGFCLPKNWGVLIPIFLFVLAGSLMNIPSRGIPFLVLIVYMLQIFMEELFSKSLIQNELERIFGIKYMWIVAGILFGLYHVPLDFFGAQHLKNHDYLVAFEQFAIQTSGGLWACAVYKKTRSLYPAVLIHWIGNSFHYYLFYSMKGLF